MQVTKSPVANATSKVVKQPTHDLAVVIGRFQPFHLGHEHLIQKAYEYADNVLVIIGSSYQARTIKNPFSYKERAEMIRAAIEPTIIDFDRMLSFAAARDFMYEDNKWIQQIQTVVAKNCALIPCANGQDNPKVALIGHDKDDSTFYLKCFPMFDSIDPGSYIEADEQPINATQIRNLLWEGQLTFLKGVLDTTTYDFITKKFVKTDKYTNLVEENEFIKKYKSQWEDAPYPVAFQTVDSVLIQGGHILLVERGAAPGKGLWALPGGFVDPTERFETAMLRELREETMIKVPTPVMKANITHRQRFDHPKRSLRGRTITEAFLIELPGPQDGKLPKVKGNDDAKYAKWFPISQVLDTMSEQMFEDHHSIISMLTSRAR